MSQEERVGYMTLARRILGHSPPLAFVVIGAQKGGTTTLHEILKEHPVYLKGRADIFMAGILILEGFMEKESLSQLIVSTGGIRHGAILKA